MTTSVLGIADDRALGSAVRVIVTRPASLAAAKAAVDDVLNAIDVAASRFRPDSELSLLNTRPDQVIKVSPLLARAISTALRGAELTNGAVDPTVGSAVRLSGYDSDFESIARDGVAMELVAHRVPGWQAVRFSEATRTVVIPPAKIDGPVISGIVHGPDGKPVAGAEFKVGSPSAQAYAYDFAPRRGAVR